MPCSEFIELELGSKEYAKRRHMVAQPLSRDAGNSPEHAGLGNFGWLTLRNSTAKTATCAKTGKKHLWHERETTLLLHLR
jgi:hypothetical protein